jgi:hypothetical protein
MAMLNFRYLQDCFRTKLETQKFIKENLTKKLLDFQEILPGVFIPPGIPVLQFIFG